MDTTKKYLVWAVILICVGSAGYLLLKGGETDAGVVKIGFIGPMTGDAAAYGEVTRNTVELAIDEINAKGGRQFEVVYEDGKCSGPDSATAAQKLINVDKVKFIIGGICSGETLGAAPIAEAAKVLLLSPVSSSPDITTAGDYIFRTFASDATSGNKIAETIWARGYKSVAVIAEQTDYSQALKRVFETRYKELGGSVVISEDYASEEHDFRSQLAKVKAANPEAIYLIPQTGGSGQVLLDQVKTVGFSVPLFSDELITPPSFIAAGVSEGITFAEVDFDKDAPLAKAYLDAYAAKFGEMNGATPPVYAASSYDATYLLTELIDTYGVSPDKVKDALYRVSNRPGAAGPLTIDKNGDALREYILKQVKNGQIVPVSE